MSNNEIWIFDFDGTLYETPTTDIPKLEDAIDSAMLNLLVNKISKSPKRNEVVQILDERFERLDKSEIIANLHNQNANKKGSRAPYFKKTYAKTSFSDYIKKRISKQKTGKKTDLLFARALGKMMEPSGKGNHRISGMLNLGLDITQKEIETYYKQQATIVYRNIKRNRLMEDKIKSAKEQGIPMFIYTDNSKDNVMSGLKSLGYSKDDFEQIIDMFDCNGGNTKKMNSGIDAFKRIMTGWCETNGRTFDIQALRFYDDNSAICTNMITNGIKSFHVSPSKISEVGNQTSVQSRLK